VITTFDANILVSSSIAPAGGTLSQIIDEWKNRAFEVVISEHIFHEVQRALDDHYFRQRLTSTEITEFLTLVRTRAAFVAISVTVDGVATHPEDDLVLATALSAQADYLVTGDRQLLRLGIYAGVRIVRPREFIDILHGGA
jgi:uncharacterized protein